MNTEYTLFKVLDGDDLLEVVKVGNAIEELTILTDHIDEWVINETGTSAYLVYDDALLYIIQ